jgi:hypothetical protein
MYFTSSAAWQWILEKDHIEQSKKSATQQCNESYFYAKAQNF